MTEPISLQDVERLLHDLKQPELSAEERQWLVVVFNSPALEGGLGALGIALFPEQLHQACEAVLPHYARLAALGEDAASRYPHLKRHLDACSRCAQTYAELYRMMSATYADEVPAAPSPPQFDLSFLRPPRAMPAADWSQVWESVAEVGGQAARLFTEIRVLVTRELASFATPPGPLAPVWVTVPATRGERGVAEIRAQVLPLASPEHDLAIARTVGPVSGNQASLSVQVSQSSSQQPMNRVRVTLRDRERHILTSELTPPDGQVTFSHVGPGSYLIEVRHAGKSWELPMTFTWQA